MEKRQRFHHSVSENGNLQARIVTEYVDGEIVKNKTYSDPVSPTDAKDMTGWDDLSKSIVIAITDKKVLADFEIEKQAPSGNGIEEIVRYDRTLDDLGRIFIRRVTRIYDNGIEVSKKFHRTSINPGQNLAGNDVMSTALAKSLHTPEVIAEYKAWDAEIAAS